MQGRWAGVRGGGDFQIGDTGTTTTTTTTNCIHLLIGQWIRIIK